MSSVEGLMGGLRISKRIEQEAERALQKEGISAAMPIVSEKCGKGEPGNVPLTTNVYGVMMQQQLPVYRYDVKMTANLQKQDGSIKQLDLTKKVQGDAVVVDRRNRCRDVYLVFQEMNSSFLKDPKCVYFDLQSILFSLNQLDVPEATGVTFKVPAAKLGKLWEGFADCDIEIRRVTEKFQLTLGDFSSISRDLTQVEHSLGQFLDVATSQHLLFSPSEHITFSANSSFLLNHIKYGFKDNDVAAFQDNGSYLAIGAQKSIKMVEGPATVRGRNTALVVETKKTPFHMVENLFKKATRLVRDIHRLQNGDFDKLSKTLAGLHVETRHIGRFQRFLVKGLEKENSEIKMINVDGCQLSVKQYFFQKYKITLKEPKMPLVVSRGKDNTLAYIPMELCYVVDNQRVKTNQQTSKQIQESIKKCAIPPSQLRDQNALTYSSLQLTNNFIKNAQLKITAQPLALNGRSLPPPDFEFRSRFIAKVRTDNFTWQGKQFLIPASCRKWAACAFLNQQDRLVENDFRDFLMRFLKETGDRGMQVPQFDRVKVIGSDQKALRMEVKQASEAGCDFFLIIHPDTADEIHAGLKLYEREFSIVTQAIRYGTLMNMIQKGQPMTLQNIVNKTNIKLGGLNYSLSMDAASAREALGTNTLYIGFGMNHPGGGLGTGDELDANLCNKKVAAPSIIGYAANVGLVHEFEFVGDSVFQEPLRNEKVNIVSTIVERCLEKYRANRKSDPKRLIIYRDGCGEGQFPMILKYELPLVKLALQKKKCPAGVTMIVSNKLQSIRFFNKDINAGNRAADQNIKPGLVVDHSVVHPEFSEFFLNSHRALQGTARTPKYTILVNESKLGLDQLERITYQLCYGHQIVYMPTSLPSPVYIGNRYAERGRKLYQRWIKSTSSDHSEVDYIEMTQRLGYYGNKVLENRRVNA